MLMDASKLSIHTGISLIVDNEVSGGERRDEPLLVGDEDTAAVLLVVCHHLDLRVGGAGS